MSTDKYANLRAAAQAVIERWDTPNWKDAPATAEYIGRLRQALAAAPQCGQGCACLAQCGDVYAHAAGQASTLAEWHEDDGAVVWWALRDGLWLGEPAWIGQPTDDDWPGYHTHWTSHPEQPLVPEEGMSS